MFNEFRSLAGDLVARMEAMDVGFAGGTVQNAVLGLGPLNKRHDVATRPQTKGNVESGGSEPRG